MKFEKLKTSKLFYNKWPYKVTCNIVHARSVTGNKVGYYYGYGKRISPEEEAEIEKFRIAVKGFLKKDIKYRAEYNHFNIFCDDKVLLKKISKKLEPWIQNIYGPQSEEELQYLKDNGHKKRVCDKFPKRKYQYRIYFKTNMPDTLKQSFQTWIAKYEGKIDCSGSTQKWLKNDHRWFQAPFCYVEDSATLSMIGLFLANYIKVVEHFVLRESINTPSE
jgi:hypothetical protein